MAEALIDVVARLQTVTRVDRYEVGPSIFVKQPSSQRRVPADRVAQNCLVEIARRLSCVRNRSCARRAGPGNLGACCGLCARANGCTTDRYECQSTLLPWTSTGRSNSVERTTNMTSTRSHNHLERMESRTTCGSSELARQRPRRGWIPRHTRQSTRRWRPRRRRHPHRSAGVHNCRYAPSRGSFGPCGHAPDRAI
jgi:hypothetical protein